MLAETSTQGFGGPMAQGWFVNCVGFGHGGDNLPGYMCYLVGFSGGPPAAKNGEQPRNGIAVMTNSYVGHVCMKHIVAAIMRERLARRRRCLAAMC